MFTRTKIICTIGPATSELSTMQKMYAAGMNVVRINMSHASHDEALNVIKNVKLINKNPDIKKGPISILIDTQGPEIRTGDRETSLDLKLGDKVNLTVRDEVDVETSSIKINYRGLINSVKKGSKISVDNGLVNFKVLEKHDDKLLNTYQSERSSNVKEYIETTMRMGEFVNAVGKSPITNNISADSEGRKSMKSIKPKLGRGLGKPKDKFRGNIFPQFKNNGKNLDIKFSRKPILVLSDKFKQSLSNKINYYRNKSNTKLSRYLENVNCEGLIVRPDRFILASIKNLKDVKLITKRNLKLLI